MPGLIEQNGIIPVFSTPFDLTSLISYWKLEEASGTRVDSHSTNDLTDNNTVTQSAGKLGNAGQFTAANSEYLSHADNAALSVADIDFAFTVWIYADSWPLFPIIIRKGDAGSTREYVLYHNSAADKLTWQVSTGVPSGTVERTGALSTATWYFIYIEHDSVGNTLGISVNNETLTTAAYSGGSADNTGPFEIGGGSDQLLWFDGRIDSVSFWKRLLTAAERTSLYNSGTGLEYPF